MNNDTALNYFKLIKPECFPELLFPENSSNPVHHRISLRVITFTKHILYRIISKHYTICELVHSCIRESDYYKSHTGRENIMSNSPFESTSIPKAYFSLSLPVVFGMVITIFYNITDTYFIALTKNTELVAGVSLCAPVFTLLMAFGNIFGQGGSSLISRLLGENQQDDLERVSSFCFYAAIAFGAFFGGLMLIFRSPLLGLLGVEADTMPYALPYFTVMAVGAPLVVLTFIHTNLLRAEGMSKEAMFANVGGSILNIIFDPVLIFGLHMGVLGAAIATVMGYIFTDVFCLAVVLKKSRVLSVNVRKWKISGEHIGQIFGIGTAAALSNIMSSFCMVLTNQYLLNYGSDKIAAMGICQKVSMIVMLVITGFSFGGAPLIGFYYGKKDAVSLKALLRFVIKFLGGLSLTMSVVLMIAAPGAVRLFLTDTDLIKTGVLMLRGQLAGMVFMAAVLMIQIIFQATGKTLPSLLLSVSRQGVVFAAVLFIGVYAAGYYGIVFAQPIADLVSAILASVLLKMAFQKDSTVQF